MPANALTSPRIDDQQLSDGGIPRFRLVVTYTAPSSYVTGGDSLLTSDVTGLLPALNGVGTFDDILPSNPITNGTNVVEATYVYSTGKLQIFDPSTKAEIGNGTNLSGYSCRIEIICH